MDDVAKADGMFRNPQANSTCLPMQTPPFTLSGIKGTALSRINRLAVFSSGSLAFLLELLFATKAQVGFACAEQSLGVLAIHFEPLGLPIGTKRTPNVGPFIPIETQPFQI